MRVVTKFGPVLGRVERLTIGKVDHAIKAFRNIPYATVPQFRYATDPPTWSAERPVVDQTPHFPQPDEFNKANWRTLPRIIGEDQVTYHGEDEPLPLNVFTPGLDNGKRPVVVYVHGGSLVIGGASSYDGHAMAAVGDVVVVSINYRLGISGTASFGVDDGNWCLSDVLQALKWVRENIGEFGGDASCVTLMGYSVGGMMVDGLMSSPLSVGLFHRAISMSGNFSSPWVVNSRLSACQTKYAERSGVTPGELQSKMEDLPFDEFRALEATGWLVDYEWTDLVEDESERDLRNFYFVLRTGDSIVPQNPYTNKAAFKMNVPYLIGTTNDEGGYSISYYHHPNFITGLSRTDFVFLLAKTAANRGLVALDADFERFAAKVIETFGVDLDVKSATYYSVIWGRWFGKVEMGAGLLERARSHSAPSFVYEHCTEPRFSRCSDHAGTMDLRPPFSKCDHGDCYSFIFGLPFYAENAQGVKFTPEERSFSLEFITHLTNFARNGSPGENWPDFRQNEQVKSLSPGASYARPLTDYEQSVESYFMSEIKEHLC